MSAPAAIARAAASAAHAFPKVTYPAVRQANTGYLRHGTYVPDPYQWLEDPDGEETKKFVQEQSAICSDVLNSYPHKDALYQKVTAYQNYPRIGTPMLHGKPREAGAGFYFYHNTGMQNQSVLKKAATLADVQGFSGVAHVDPAADATTKSTAIEKIETFFDPNTLSTDGTSAIGATAWSHSDRYFAYGINEKGSDWSKIYVKDAVTGKTMDDCVKWVKFSGISWLGDIGFFYTRFPALKTKAAAEAADGAKAAGEVDLGAEVDTAENGAVYFHLLGQADGEANDIRVFDYPAEPKWLMGAEVSDDGALLMVSLVDGCKPLNLLHIARIPKALSAPAAPLTLDAAKELLTSGLKFVPLITEWTAQFDYLANDDDLLYFRTTYKAPTKRIIKLNVTGFLADPATAVVPPLSELPFEEVVAAREQVLDFCTVARNVLILVYLKDVKHQMSYRQLASGPELEVDIPIGTIVGLSARRWSDFIAFKMTSFLLAGRSFYCWVTAAGGGKGGDVEWGCPAEAKEAAMISTVRVFKDDTVPGFDPDAFEVRQVFYDAPIGVLPPGATATSGETTIKIPMFILHKKGLKRNCQNPTLLYAYGGFNISLTPSFAVSRLTFMSSFEGATVAIANIRGGGEYGLKWYEGGKAETKENCFSDFIAAAKWLQEEEKICSPLTLTVMGGSNGGLLVAASTNRSVLPIHGGSGSITPQSDDATQPQRVISQTPLWAAVICQVGVLDAYKFHQFTIGHAWTSDFGDPDKEADFRLLQKYSPLHNIHAGQVHYPAILVMTADHDDRVVPLHSYKYVAAMQACHPNAGQGWEEGTDTAAKQQKTSALNPDDKAWLLRVSRRPCLARIEMNAGHGAGRPLSKSMMEIADYLSFLAMATGAKWIEEPAKSA